MRHSDSGGPFTVGGVVPSLAVTADTAPEVPAGLPRRSESGVGALMPWADRLYMVSYLSVPNYGAGTGLYAIDPDLKMEKIANQSVAHPFDDDIDDDDVPARMCVCARSAIHDLILLLS